MVFCAFVLQFYLKNEQKEKKDATFPSKKIESGM